MVPRHASSHSRPRRLSRHLGLALLAALLCGCGSPSETPAPEPRQFVVVHAEEPDLTPRASGGLDPDLPPGAMYTPAALEWERLTPDGMNPDLSQTVQLSEGPLSATLPDFAAVYEKAAPSVVVIRVTRPGGNEGLGTGFFFGRKGRVVTNEHVVRGGTHFRIQTYDGQMVSGSLIGADPGTDLALLKVVLPHPPRGLVPIPEGATRRGMWVLAIGNPLGLEFSATRGIVSAMNRGEEVWDSPGTWDFLQTDAAINRGNSGGPLVDTQGRVVGVAAALEANADRIAFAIPIDLTQEVVFQLERFGRLHRQWMGVQFERRAAGIHVSGIYPGSPAEEAGLRPGDLVLGLDGEGVADLSTLRWRIALHPQGLPALLVIRRGERDLEVEVKLEPEEDSQT